MDHSHHNHPQVSEAKYTCPMHPEIKTNAPGKCPKCGMDLVPIEKNKSENAHGKYSESSHHEHTNHKAHDKHAGHHTSDFLNRFWICLVLTLPVLLLSKMIQDWMGLQISFPGNQYVLLALGTIVYIYGGKPFLTGMISEIRDRAIGMMTLVAIAITVAFIYSAAVVLGLKGMDFFWELATLIDIMLLGHWLEMRSQMAASNALQSLVALLPSVVHMEKNGAVQDVDVNELKNNDIVIIRPGEKVPADGIVIEGRSFANESMLTGESIPVKKEKNQKVIAGSINGDGMLKVKVTGTGKDSYINKVITMVDAAQSSKSKTQNLADRVAKWLTIVSIVVGITTFFIWFNHHDLAFALERMVTVMVTSCPHALGVAIPLVVAISTSASARHGLLIRNRTAFENARKITTVIFDKTGTLTKGSHEVQKIVSLTNEVSSNDILQYAAAVQQHSEHYLARGIMRKLETEHFALWPSKEFNYQQGIGVSAMVNHRKVIVAGPNYFKSENKPVPPVPDEIDQGNETITYVIIDGNVTGMITLSDTIRESSAAAIEQLKKMHIKTYLLTGDNEQVAASVAGRLHVDGYFANVLPHQKLDKIKEFQNKGEVVAMAGDGVNDAPALAQADVGIAVGSGTDVAAETADMILVNSDPADVAELIRFGRQTYRKMIQNLSWAIGYNVIAIPLAAGILYPSFMLSAAMGAILMSLSTVIVAINAKLLKLK